MCINGRTYKVIRDMMNKDRFVNFMYKFLGTAALILMSATAPGFGYTQGTEGVSRQVQALRSALESFSAAVRAELDSVDGELDAFKLCANKSMLYAPNSPDKDADGCLPSGGGHLTSVAGGRIVDTGVDREQTIRLRRDTRIDLDIYQYEDAHNFSDVRVQAYSKTYTQNWETGREGNEDSHTATATVLSEVEIGNSWVKIPSNPRIQVHGAAGITLVGDVVYQGLWTGKIATPKGGRSDAFMGFIHQGDSQKPKLYKYR